MKESEKATPVVAVMCLKGLIYHGQPQRTRRRLKQLMELTLTQMYFHLLISSIYFSFHVFLLCLLNVEKNSGYDVVEWRGIGYYLLAEPFVVCVHEKGENVFSPIAPSDNQCFRGLFSCGSRAMALRIWRRQTGWEERKWPPVRSEGDQPLP